MIEFTLWVLMTVIEFAASFAIPAYISLKLVSKKVKTDEAKDIEQYKLWSFYWILLIVVWQAFTYLDFIPYLYIIRALFAVALVYPKINLLEKAYKAVLADGLLKDTIEQAKEFANMAIKRSNA